MKVSRALCAAALFVFGSVPQLVNACITVYLDHDIDTTSEEVQAWSYVEDCYGMGGSNPPPYQHQYYAAVDIYGPAQQDHDFNYSGPTTYGGDSSYSYGFVSYDGAPGVYDIEWEVWILCSLAGYFFQDIEDIDVPAPDICAEVGATAIAIASMIGWSPLAYERGGSVICLGNVAIPFRFMDSFELVYQGSYYEPTNDPCELALYQTGVLGGFHSHPRFTHQNQVNEGETCHGDGPYILDNSGIAWLNGVNANFQGEVGLNSSIGGDFAWPPGTNSPLYLLTPNTDKIKILPINLIDDTVWPL